MAEAGTWKETFRIRSYEMDPTGQASIPTLCNYLQEVAGNHAFDLGVSVEQLFEQNQTWVLARLRLQLDAYPKWREDVTVETWPSGVEGLFATRDFLLKDSDAGVFGRATSGWMMIDLERRRPVRMPESITSLKRPDRERAIAELTSRLPAPDGGERTETLRVRYSDLDVNGHVNNVRYVEWALEAMSAERLRSHELTELEVHFRAEAVYGDPVTVRVAHLGDGAFAHVITQSESDKELARIRTMWKPR